MKHPIVILHGWSNEGKREKYDAIKEIFENKGYKVYIPDLPGFGNNPIKKEALFFEDYIEFVLEFIKSKKLEKVILLGHSFGGRIAIRFTSLHQGMVEKLLLTGASGIPHSLPSLKNNLLFLLTKLLKPIFLFPPMSFFYKFFRKLLYYSIGEMDYYKAGSLSQTFKNVYKVSVVDDLGKIHIPTLLIWGEKDTFTPLVDGKYMQNHIPHSKLIVIPNASHRLPYENPAAFTQAVLSFLS